MEKFIRVEVVTGATKLSGFKHAMSKIGVSGMTVTQVMGCGVQKGTPEYIDDINEEIELLPKQLIMMIIKEGDLDKVLDVVSKELYTGHIGDGKIFVSDVKNIVRIRTGEEGLQALI